MREALTVLLAAVGAVAAILAVPVPVSGAEPGP